MEGKWNVQYVRIDFVSVTLWPSLGRVRKYTILYLGVEFCNTVVYVCLPVISCSHVCEFDFRSSKKTDVGNFCFVMLTWLQPFSLQVM